MFTPSRATSTTSFRRAFSVHLIFDRILDLLGHVDRFRCRRTCRLLYLAVTDYHARAYNINRHLARFFSDPVGFRSLQARLGMLISGSTALQFFERTVYPASDLDLYVWQADARIVGQWLRDREGYVFTPSSVQDPDFDKQDWPEVSAATMDMLVADPTAVNLFHVQQYRSKEVAAVFTFRREIVVSEGDVEERKVQVICATRCPLWTVLNFHSTCVMNVIAFDAAYSLYPRATFVERRSLCTSSVTAEDNAALAKYAERGWQILAHIFPHRRSELWPFYPSETRWVRDGRSWVQPLDVTGVQTRRRESNTSDEISFDPVSCNSWRLRTFNMNTHRHPMLPPCAMATNHVTRNPILRYTYLVADRRLLNYLLAFLEMQGKLEDIKASGLPTETRQQVWTWWDYEVKYIVDAFRNDLEWDLVEEEDVDMEED